MRRGLLILFVTFATLAAGSLGVADAAAESSPAAGPVWTAQTLPLPPGETFGYLVSVSCTSATSCVGVGLDNLQTAVLTEIWNGSTWTAEVPPLPSGGSYGELMAVSCTSAISCVATGFYVAGMGGGEDDMPLAEVWDGSTWTAAAPPIPRSAANAYLNSISCTSATSCLAAGSYAASSGRRLIAESWNGSAWTLQHIPTPVGTEQDIAGVSCGAAGNCIAVGGYSPPDEAGTYLIQHFNGTGWTRMFAPLTYGAINFAGISCPAADNCTAVGNTFGSTTYHLAAEHWNGSYWKAQNIPLSSGSDHWDLQGVSCGTPDSCLAVGENTVAMADRSNGHRWFVQQTAVPRSGKDLIADSCLSSGFCMAVGMISGGSAGELPLAEEN